MGTEIDSTTGAKSRYLAALRDHSPVERGRNKVLLHHSPEHPPHGTSETMAQQQQRPPPPPPPPPPPRVAAAAAGAQSVVSKWADRSTSLHHRDGNSNESNLDGGESTTTSDFFIPVDPPPPPPPPRASSPASQSSSSFVSKSSSITGKATNATPSPTSHSTLSAWKQRQLGRNSLIPPPISSSPSSNTSKSRAIKQLPAKHNSSIPSPTSLSSLQNQPWVKKRNLSVSTSTETSPATLSSSADSTDQAAPPPQLAYQKSQWNAERDIPRGLVAQKVAGQQQKLQRENPSASKTRLMTNTTTTSTAANSVASLNTASTSSSLNNHRLPGVRMPQPTPEGIGNNPSMSSNTTNYFNAAPPMPMLEDNVVLVQPPPSPRHARQQLSPNYNNGMMMMLGNNKERDDRLWGASSTSPRLAAAAAAASTSAGSPSVAAAPRHFNTNSSMFSDPFAPAPSTATATSSNRYKVSATISNNGRQQAPFPDRNQELGGMPAPSPKGSGSDLEWNTPVFPISTSSLTPPPPPPADESPDSAEFQKDFSAAGGGPLSPSRGNTNHPSWLPKVASPKGRLTNNFFVQADSPRRNTHDSTTPTATAETTTTTVVNHHLPDSQPGQQRSMFWGDDSMMDDDDDDEQREDRQEPEPVQSPSQQRTASALSPGAEKATPTPPPAAAATTKPFNMQFHRHDPFGDFGGLSPNTTTAPMSQQPQQQQEQQMPSSSTSASNGWSSQNPIAPISNELPIAPKPVSRAWPTSRFIEDDVDWFENGHVFSTDTDTNEETASLQNSVLEQKSLLGGGIRSSSSGLGDAVACDDEDGNRPDDDDDDNDEEDEEDLEEKKMDEMASNTISPRSLGSPEEVASLASRKNKSISPSAATTNVMIESRSANQNISNNNNNSALTQGMMISSPRGDNPSKASPHARGWEDGISADSESKESNATSSQSETVEAAAAAAAISKDDVSTKKNRFGILNIFGAGKSKKSRDSGGGASVSSKQSQGVNDGADSNSSKSKAEVERGSEQASGNSGSQGKPSREVMQAKSHDVSLSAVPYQGSLTYNRSEGDDTTISEMTNPTVFQSSKKEMDASEQATQAATENKVTDATEAQDVHEATTPKAQLRNSSNEQSRSFKPPSVATSSSPTELDPFDVNSPVFASGDPFSNFGVSKSHSKESFSVSDPFFDAEDEVEEQAFKDESQLNVPDPPLEHVELLSSDDEEEEVTTNKPDGTPVDLLPTPIAANTSASSNGFESEKKERDATVISDPILPSADEKPVVVASSKSVPDVTSFKSSSMKSSARARAAALKASNSMATTTKSVPKVETLGQSAEDKSLQQQSAERSVPTVAPRLFASVAKSRKRIVTASSASSLEQAQQVKPAAPMSLIVSADSPITQPGLELIPKNVDVSTKTKSPKSGAIELSSDRKDDHSELPQNVPTARSLKTAFESSSSKVERKGSVEALSEKVQQPTHRAATQTSKNPSIRSIPIQQKRSLAKSHEITSDLLRDVPVRSGTASSDSMDQVFQSLTTESTETRDMDSVETARSAPATGSSILNPNVLLMKRRNEKRRQFKSQEQSDSVKQQASSNLQQPKSQNNKSPPAPPGTSAYLGRFNQKKSTSNAATRDVTNEAASDANALPLPPPAIERIHADFDREISKLMPKMTSSSSIGSRGPKETERRKTAPIPEDGSISSSASSYRSRKPRSILRKGRRGIPETTASSSQELNDIIDPMHRAGLRLLAAAIIPIQCAARRFLAKRQTVRRVWAIVVIQAYLRRWLAEQAMSRHFASIEIQTCFRRWIALRNYTQYRAAVLVQTCFRRWTAEHWFKQYKAAKSIQKSYRCWNARSLFKRQITAAVAVQTLFRGWFARDCLLYQHYSAMQLQRMVRGYLATIYVYEYIYKVTIVQSCFRRKMAIDDAAYRLSFIMQLQSIVRGYLVRKKLAIAHSKAVVVQSAWRCYSTRMNYRFDLIDIIIIQNYWRRRSAKRLVSQMKHDRMMKSATKIQAQWRSYDCTMNYLHYLADVLIVQCAVRRRMARRVVADIRFSNAARIQKVARSFLVRNRIKKHNAAVAIQRTWRGFVCYADYMFTVADIVIVQTRIRGLLARREAKARRSLRNYNAAVEIQRRWRGFADYQRALVMQADIIICQSTARRYLALKLFKQTVRVYQSAIKIQSAWRGFVCFRAFLRDVSARVIARSWRRHIVYQTMRRNRSATCIARSWKLHRFRSERDIASIILQKYWRRFVKETEYFIMKFEYQAATTIQSAWRRFWNFSNFVIMLDSSIRLQARWRCFRDKYRFSRMLQAVTTIQCASRVYLARKRVDRTVAAVAMVERSRSISTQEGLAVTRLQSVIRGRRIRLAVRLYLSARKVQSWIRGTFARYAVKVYLSARKIQSRFRGARVRVAVNFYLSARRIQAKWRGYRLRHPYVNFISARRIQTSWRSSSARRVFTRYIASRRIQAAWRCSKARRNYTILRGEILAASLIQAAWRGFLCYTDYIFTVADVIAAQRVARMYLARKQFRSLRDERDRQIAAVQVQRYWRGFLGRNSASLERALHDRELQQNDAAVHIQRVWRGYDQKQIYWYVLGCAIQIQRFARGKLVREHMKAENWAATTIQALARRYFCRIEYHRRMIDTLLIAVAVEEANLRNAAITIQRWWSVMCEHERENDRRSTAAVVIQRFFLMVKAEVDREIQAEKKRRKMKKKMKHRTSQDDDDILERVWMSTISQDETETNIVRYAVSTAAIEVDRNKARSSGGAQSVEQGSDCGTGVDGDPVLWSDLNNKQGEHFQFNQSSPRKMQERVTLQPKHGLRTPVRKKHLLPPTYANGDLASPAFHGSEQQLPETVRLRPGSRQSLRGDDDAASEVSGLTTGSSVYRIPPSRLETMNRKEMDEDFDLEEAWIDAEIRSVKERKMAENRENTPIDYVYPFPSPAARATPSPVPQTLKSRDAHRKSSSRQTKTAT